MQRRTILAALAAAALARPAILRAAQATTLRFIPQIDLAFLDPHWTTANVTRNHGHVVFDTLYGCDTTLPSRATSKPPPANSRPRAMPASGSPSSSPPTTSTCASWAKSLPTRSAALA